MKYLIMFLLASCASDPQRYLVTTKTTTTYYPPPPTVIKYVEVPTKTDYDYEMEMWEMEQEEEESIKPELLAPVSYKNKIEYDEPFEGFDEPAAWVGEEE